MSLIDQLPKDIKQKNIRHLLIIQDTKDKRIIELKKNIYSIGREAKNSIVIHSPLVSRHHATLLKVTDPESDDYCFQIVDGDLQGNYSTNGLIINGQRCSSKSLQHKDSIVFGGNAQARYLVIDYDFPDSEILRSDNISDLLNKSGISTDPFDTLITSSIYNHPLNEAVLLRLASFPELLPSPIIEIDLSGKITYLNSAALQNFPHIQKLILKHPILIGLIEIISSERKDFFVREVEIEDKVFEQSVYFIAESRLIRSYLADITERKQKEEELRQHREHLQQLVEERTASLKAINKKLEEEIIERQKIESVLRQQALAFENIYDAIIITNLQGTVSDWNRGAERMFGYSKSEVLGKTLTFLHKPEESAILTQQILEGISCTGRWVGEINYIRKDATEGICETIFVPLYNELGERIAIIGVSHDVTERKEAEEEIHKALLKEKELNELKSRFVSMASHEFRTPLAKILISSDLLKSFGEKLSDEKKTQQLNKIQIAVKEMTQLLDDVLLVGKAESGKIEFKPAMLNLEGFCREILEEIQLTVGSKHYLKFDCQRECSDGECSIFEMDQKLLRHILINLLSNAIKYSPEGSPIYFNLVSKNKEAIFRVQDQGIGIPEADKPRIFEGFHRASNVGNIAGTGLGLAIIKNAVELHKGSITFESAMGKGTTFIVSIPTVQNK